MSRQLLFLLGHSAPLASAIQLVNDLRSAGLAVRVGPDQALLKLVSKAGWQELTGQPIVLPEELPLALAEKPFAVLVQGWESAWSAPLQSAGIPMLMQGDSLPSGAPTDSVALAEFTAACIGAHLERLSCPQDYVGKTVLVTAGPTVEDIDPVRFVTNRSSGKMGVAIAWGAAMRGARVQLVHGPMTASIPEWPLLEDYPVRSAQQMHDKVRELWPSAQVAVLCAAVADFRPDHYVPQKIKKIEGEGMVLSLERTPDILAELGALPKHPLLVGFAAETDDLEINALNKLRKKHCDLLCANDIRQPGSGFAVDTNQITIYARDGRVIPLPMLSKRAAAQELLQVLSEYF